MAWVSRPYPFVSGDRSARMRRLMPSVCGSGGVGSFERFSPAKGAIPPCARTNSLHQGKPTRRRPRQQTRTPARFLHSPERAKAKETGTRSGETNKRSERGDTKGDQHSRGRDSQKTLTRARQTKGRNEAKKKRPARAPARQTKRSERGEEDGSGSAKFGETSKIFCARLRL
jgi:hypothetical protein